MTKHSRNKVARVGAAWAVLFVLCLGALFWVMVSARNAEASVNLAPIESGKSFSAPKIIAIGATEVLTDLYENNDTVPYSLGTVNFGQPCATPLQIAFNASFYREPLNLNDVDLYSVIAGGSTVYTFFVQLEPGQTPTTPINFVLQILNASSVSVGSQTNNAPSVSFYSVADNQTYRIQLNSQNPGFAPRDQSYRILYCSSPTQVSPTATPTLTPIPTATTAGAQPDTLEPNDSPAEVLARVPVASYISVGQPNIAQQIQNLNFYPQVDAQGKLTKPVTATREQGDNDWYFVYLRQHTSVASGTGGTYRLATVLRPGVDTELALYRDNNCLVPTGDLEKNSDGGPKLFAFNDDAAILNRGSQIEFNSDKDCVYWVRLINKDAAPRGSGQTYDLTIQEFIGTPFPTLSPAPTTQATPYPAGRDSFEYNGDFERASLIAPGSKYSGLNFVPFEPPNPDTVDNDFFRLPVKQGIYYTCETLDLTGGVDTNIIVYNQDRAGIGGNDDTSAAERALGKFGSRVTWLAGYTGIAYILVGEVSPPRPNESSGQAGQTRTYALQCIIGIPNTPTPIGGSPTPTPVPSPAVTATPEPPESTLTPFPTPRTAQNLPVRKLVDGQIPGRGANAPTLVATATPRPVALDMQIFNDNNRNGLLDPGEGINGTSIRILDEASGTPLGQTATDGEGRARFTIFNEGPVRVSVPMFGYSTLINEPQATVRIALVPSEQLPARIP